MPEQPKESKESRKRYLWDLERLNRDWSGYTCLGDSLKALNFNTYNDFYKSPLYQNIRARVLFAHRYRCLCCGSKATVVYQTSYDYLLMSGGSSCRDLHAVCVKCFRDIRYEGEARRHVADSYFRFMQLREVRMGPWSEGKRKRFNKDMQQQLKQYYKKLKWQKKK